MIEIPYPNDLKNLYLRATSGNFPNNLQIGQKIIFTGDLFIISKNEQENIRFKLPHPLQPNGTFYLTYIILKVNDNSIDVNMSINLRFIKLNYKFYRKNRNVIIDKDNRIGIFHENLFTEDLKYSYKLDMDAQKINFYGYGNQIHQFFHAKLRVVDLPKGGGYYEKYMKYKEKYLKLKSMLSQ
jgi:hypothetical protein